MIASGTLLSAHGALFEARLAGARIGQSVRIKGMHRGTTGVVTALERGRALIAPHGDPEGFAGGDAVIGDACASSMPLGTALLGRCIDGCGAPLDGCAPPCARRVHVREDAPLPTQRVPIEVPFWTGVRVLDGLLTFGLGARIGIFGEPGTGKTTLLQLLLRGAHADAIVIGLVGERGREAHEWMRHAGDRTTICCATSDRSAAERVRAAQIAMAQAAQLRERGLHVLLILDSLARLAAALRELALASGEAAGRGGYPPSVFARLARLCEMAGAQQGGSITMVATVLSDGDERDPVSECARSLLDGHIELRADLARAGRFPAVDVLASRSRTMDAVATPEHLEAARLLRRALAHLARTADARDLGMLPAGTFALRVLQREAEIEAFLTQDKRPEPPARTLALLRRLADTLE